MKRVNLTFLSFVFISNVHAQFIIAGQHTTSDYFHDVIPDSTFMATNFANNNIDTVMLDLNGDSIDDFILGVRHSESPGAGSASCCITALNNNELAFGGTDSCFNYNAIFMWTVNMEHAFHDNDSINENALWVQGYLNLCYMSRMYLNYWCGNCTFTMTDTAYVGVKIYSANDTLYGWIKVTGVSTSKFTLIEYACNAGSAIGIKDQDKKVLVTIYPNPFTSQLNITLINSELSQIILYDFLSRKLIEETFTNSAFINTEQLPKGIYYYEIRNKSGIITKGKVVKQ